MTINSKAGIIPHRILNQDKFTKLNEVLICKICFNILTNATDCIKCGNTFCYDCINELKQFGKDCPFGCKGINIKPTSHGITSMLAQLRLSCLNKDYGCEEVLQYSNVIKHDQTCKYTMTSCPNLNCNTEIKRQQLEHHIRNECEYSLFRCENCELDLSRSEYPEHVHTCKTVNECLNSKNINDLMDIDVNDISMFMKIVLFQIARITQENDKRFSNILEEMRYLRQDISVVKTYLQNINPQFESKLNSSTTVGTSFSTGQTTTGNNLITFSAQKSNRSESPKQISSKKVITLKPEIKKFKIEDRSKLLKEKDVAQSPLRIKSFNRLKSNSPKPVGQKISEKIDNKSYTPNHNIMDLLNKIIMKIDKAELDTIQSIEGLQGLLVGGIAEDIKNNTQNVSLDICEKIIKKFYEINRHA
jgi:hypothetical protein